MDNTDILTKRQREILDFMVGFYRKYDSLPSYRVIGKHFGIKSTNGVSCHLMSLCRKEYISFLQGPVKKIVFTQKTRSEYFMGKALSKKTCVNCKFGTTKNAEPPCSQCRRLPKRLRHDKWKPRTQSIAIKIGESANK
jgi:SOS-response transcriptional repressor LexA